MNLRQQNQQRFEAGDDNLIVGCKDDCPLAPELLALTTSDSYYVVETFDSGLTAEVYRIRLNEQDFTLKKKREVAKVQNPDGRFSFLNEVQRRADFQKLKMDQEKKAAYQCIVNTVYADFRLGIILSDWIEGVPIKYPEPQLMEQLFTTLIECEAAGLFEWDLCAGNLLVDADSQLWMFDFGYMYPFNPLTEFNSNGTHDPVFNFCERFETRFFSGWLLRQQYSHQQALDIFKQVKLAAFHALEKKISWLKYQGGTEQVISYFVDLKATCQEAFHSQRALERQYILDMFRSHVLDIEDDLEGKSCTSLTIKRVEVVLDILANNYALLQDGGLFYQNKGKSKEELIKAYQEKLQRVYQYQL